MDEDSPPHDGIVHDIESDPDIPPEHEYEDSSFEDKNPVPHSQPSKDPAKTRKKFIDKMSKPKKPEPQSEGALVTEMLMTDLIYETSPLNAEQQAEFDSNI